jgi:DNA replication protein DnaC
LATALGHQSCIKGYKVLYYNLGKLFQKLMMAKADGFYIRELIKIENHDLLIIDDFGLQAISNEKQMILMDLVEDRIIHSAIRFELKGESVRKKMKK